MLESNLDKINRTDSKGSGRDVKRRKILHIIDEEWMEIINSTKTGKVSKISIWEGIMCGAVGKSEINL